MKIRRAGLRDQSRLKPQYDMVQITRDTKPIQTLTKEIQAMSAWQLANGYVSEILEMNKLVFMQTMGWGYPPPTHSEIIICSFLWRAPYKPSLSTVSGPGIPPKLWVFFSFLFIQQQDFQLQVLLLQWFLHGPSIIDIPQKVAVSWMGRYIFR